MPQSPLQEYFDTISDRYKRGSATEHTYRGDLQKLIESIVKGITATNEPKRIECGAPDYILTRKDIPVGYIEAKDIGKHLTEVEKSEQLKRYRDSLDNLILTDYLDFRWFIHGEKKFEVNIAHIENGKLKADKDNWPRFEDLIKDFCSYQSQTITGAETLAKMMAAKARLMHNVLEQALIQDEKDTLNDDTSLQQQYKAFKDILIHEIKPDEFADIYAQTIAYGMFAARIHDNTPDDFTREKAAKLIPSSNPFLRRLFQYIAGYDLDTRLAWIVDTLAEVFRATDINAVLKNFGKSTKQNDPVIHFYETFLSEYNPALRKSRGVWYTPEPVVNFIVRAVDDILKTEFGLKDGLSDTSKIKVKVKGVTKATADKRSNLKEYTVDQEFHKVQILDPATGTGTFLAEVIRQVYKKFEGQQGIWSNYVDEHLIPRINGFEILMASYAMAHLKLEMLLTETGHKPKKDQRLRVFLTNSLEEYHPDTGTLFAQWLSNEANEANHIKRDSPVMVIMGNPPYLGESKNKGEWILNLMDDYKKEPSGGKLKEKNSKWLNDDYVKFLRYGQYFIEKNGEGILGFINPHGFLDNPTFRGMRYNLLKTYDVIYTIDLHGNSKKKETAPDGSPDTNVFDIQQGVCINLFVKTGKKKANELGKVFHYDLYGKRELKYDFLLKNNIETIPFKEIPLIKPNYIISHKDFSLQAKYDNGVSLNELFRLNGNGIVSKRDAIAFQDSKNEMKNIIKDISELNNDEIKQKFNYISWDSRDGKVEFVKQNVMEFGLNDKLFVQCDYRPFDKKWTYYNGQSKGFIGWPVKQIMYHYLNGDNIGLIIGRQGQVVGAMEWNLSFITKSITDFNIYYRGGGMSFPLYLYPENTVQAQLHQNKERTPNLNINILGQIGEKLELAFESEKSETKGKFAPIDLLDYIYAVLHSPAYREKYKEFLKIDFPRIPYPTDKAKFWALVKLGSEIRQLHLLESKTVEKYITTYPIAGNNEVIKPNPKYNDGKVYINETQYFDKVPQVAWEFYIGGYQSAQKWLKDRQGRLLSYDDITHYQKMIVALTETARLMSEIDKIGVE